MDEIETLFNDFLRKYGEEFVKQLRSALELKYPYSPGFNDERATIGQANKIVGAMPGYSQSLYDSITAVYDFEAYEVEILMNEYWKWVNQGRQPGSYVNRQGIKSLQAWAKIRLGLDDTEALGAAFGISKNLFRFGIKPTFFYDIAVENLERIFNENQEEIAESINDFMSNKILKDIPPNNEITIEL